MQRKPYLPGELHSYVIAFGILTRSRQVGFAIGPVAITEIEAYCRMFEVDDIEMFIRLITAMDVAYLKFKQEHES